MEKLLPNITIVGATGSGKTALAEALYKESLEKQGYILIKENPPGNPEVKKLQQGYSDINFYALQNKYLDDMEKALERAENNNQPIIMDTSPSINILIYSTNLLNNGQITEDQFNSLQHKALLIGKLLMKRSFTVINLVAAPTIMRRRAKKRDGSAPPLSWFRALSEKGYDPYLDAVAGKKYLQREDDKSLVLKTTKTAPEYLLKGTLNFLDGKNVPSLTEIERDVQINRLENAVRYYGRRKFNNKLLNPKTTKKYRDGVPRFAFKDSIWMMGNATPYYLSPLPKHLQTLLDGTKLKRLACGEP
jgi:deoxyadenosine/deoxycytidine kinase